MNGNQRFCILFRRVALGCIASGCVALCLGNIALAGDLRSNGRDAELTIRAAADRCLRITLKPIDQSELPLTPVLVQRDYPKPAIQLRTIDRPRAAQIAGLNVLVDDSPLSITITRPSGHHVQRIEFGGSGEMTFDAGAHPILGMGEGGPELGRDWRNAKIEFDRRGRVHAMRPRWQANAYGSRNPVGLLIGIDGWAMWVATPWGEIDLTDKDHGTFKPWDPRKTSDSRRPGGRAWGSSAAATEGRPPISDSTTGIYDIFVFDAHDPAVFMRNLSTITGPAVMPPKWALGYMQSHRTLEDDAQMTEIVKTFRQKKIPLDAVIYLGTGFTPRGWNTEQPSFDFNRNVFVRDPADVIADLHKENVKVVVHMVPWRRDRLPSLTGSIPPAADDVLDESHIRSYWAQHIPLFDVGVDAFWPDEGDWYNLFERMKRHQLYYEGPLSSRPNVRPWSLHRNGHLGIARWGGWIWSGDTESSWKTLEAQVAVGINHSLSLSPYWGSDIGGFFPNDELTGELYARWFQFGAFCPSFRSHGKTWWMRLPWGWGLSEMGPREHRNRNPLDSELNNPAIEPIAKQYAELRYRLLPYNYTLAWQARSTGLPLMRAMWLHYPDDEMCNHLGSQYLWGRDLLIAPVFEQGATHRSVYLPEGSWYDWWTGERVIGGRGVSKRVDLATMPIYVRAGAIVPLDPVRQFASQSVKEPTTILVHPGNDGEFTLYEDDGESLAYLRESSKRTRFRWDDAARKLSIESASPKARQRELQTFRIQVVPSAKPKLVTFSGEAVEIEF